MVERVAVRDSRVPHRDSVMSDQHSFVITVECARYKTKQKMHIANRTELAQKGNERIPCIDCDHHFKVKVPALR